VSAGGGGFSSTAIQTYLVNDKQTDGARDDREKKKDRIPGKRAGGGGWEQGRDRQISTRVPKKVKVIPFRQKLAGEAGGWRIGPPARRERGGGGSHHRKSSGF